MEKPFPIEQFRGLITGNQVTGRMFEEARLINSVYASGHGSIQKLLTEEKKAHEEATRRVAAARQSGDRQQIAREQRAFTKAMLPIAALRRRQGSNLALSNRSSAAGAMESRKIASAGARHFTRSSPKAKECRLFHSFPQEVVDSIAVRTHGIRTQVQGWDSRVRVIVENDHFTRFVATAGNFCFAWIGKRTRSQKQA